MAHSRALGSLNAGAPFTANSAAFPISLPQVSRPSKRPPDAAVLDKKLYEMRVDQLREAIRNNQASFPAQIPTFSRHTRPDLQRKLVQLYFVNGWSAPQIRARYRLGGQRFQQILSTWKNRAIELGYIQAIPPDPRIALSSLRLPIRVALSPAQNGSPAPALPAVRRFGAQQPSNYRKTNGNGREIGRPRRKCDLSQIAKLLNDIDHGRTLADIANEAGVSESTVRVWKRQQEARVLERENRELRERLAKLDAIETN
jgi:transposase